MRPMPHDIGRHDVARGMTVGPYGAEGVRTISSSVTNKTSIDTYICTARDRVVRWGACPACTA